MDGNIDYFVAAASSGGTITGIGSYLKEKNPHIKSINMVVMLAYSGFEYLSNQTFV